MVGFNVYTWHERLGALGINGVRIQQFQFSTANITRTFHGARNTQIPAEMVGPQQHSRQGDRIK